MSKIGKGSPFPIDVPAINLAATTAAITGGNTLNVVINRPASVYTSACRLYTILGTAVTTDITPQNGTVVTFAPGDVTKTVAIPILVPAVAKGDVNFTVQLSNPYNAVIGVNKEVVTITGQAATSATVSTISSPTVVRGNPMVYNIALSGASLGQSFPFSVTGSAPAGVSYSLPFAFSNGVTVSGANLIVPAGVPNFTATATTIADATIRPTQTAILTIGGVAGIGTLLDNNAVVALGPLTEIVIFEAPYGKLTGAQQTAIAAGGGFPAFAVSRNNMSSPAYSVYDCATAGGTYTRVLSGQSYAQSAVVQGAVILDHRNLTLDATSEFPATIAAKSYGVLADTAGQYEHLLVNNVSTVSLLGDTNRVTTGISEAIYDSQPIAVSATDTARLYIVPFLPTINTILADATDRYYKVVPEDNTGTPLSITAVTPIKLTCKSIARKPYPSRYNTIATSLYQGGDYMPFRLGRSGRGDLIFKSGNSSRLDEITPSDYFTPASVLEAGTVINVDVMDADGANLIRTLTCDASGVAQYLEVDKIADIPRTNTRYITYTNRGGIKSSVFAWNIEQDVNFENLVTSVTNVKFSTTLVKSTLAFTAAAAAPAGTGQETGIAFVKITGTAFANIDIANIVVNTGGAEIFARDVAVGEFFIQFPRSTASVELGVPYTGSVGLTIIVSAGTRAFDPGFSDSFTGTATTTI